MCQPQPGEMARRQKRPEQDGAAVQGGGPAAEWVSSKAQGLSRKLEKKLGTVLMPEITALWEAEAGESLEVRSLRLPWPTWRNSMSLLKIHK